MKYLAVVMALVALTGCSIKATGDMSILKKLDRPNETWTMETRETPVAPATGGAK